jgi:monofunctional biosynthetic peptidoglycan transglycosylase
MAETTAGRIRVRKAKTGGTKGKKARGLLGRVALWLFGLVVVFPVLWVLAYRFVPPPITSLMAIRYVQGHGLDYRWRGLKDISPTLAQAAIASEDAQFCRHHGFDFTAMEKALAHNDRRPNRIRGGSTISQQTAKNVFLWPDRSYVRKGLEAYFTVLIEALWGKKRIMEVYLNVVEMGSGIYGAEAASRVDFGHAAKRMSTSEAARLVAILPNPLKYNAVEPGRYVQRRAGRVAGQVGVVRSDSDLSGCIR